MIESQSDGSDKQGMLVQVMSPHRERSKKSRKKQHTQSKLSIGRKSNKLIITMPTGDKTSRDSSSPNRSKSTPLAKLKDSKRKDPRSPTQTIVIDSDDSVPTTRSGKKRKSVTQQDQATSKKAKRNDSASKNGVGKGSAKRKEPSSQSTNDGSLTLEEFLRDKDINKWRYIVDVIRDENVEAIDILITKRRLAEAEKERKEIEKEQKKAMKEFKDGKIQIKSECQTDGSCDKTETSSMTGSLTENSASEKKTCHKKLAKEFFVYTYVGNQRKKLKLIEMDSAEETSYESVLNFPPDRSDIDSACTKEGESDGICGDIDMEDTGNEDEKNTYLPDSGVETENSVVEVDILKEPIVYHRVDSDTNNEKNKSTSTEKIYSRFHSGEQMSLQSVSEFKNTSSPGTIELSSDTIKDISEDDKNSSDKEKPSVHQVPETDSTVPTVGQQIKRQIMKYQQTLQVKRNR